MAAIYFHVPFCKQACHYCNFHFSTSLKHKNPVLDAMLSELKLRKEELVETEKINSIYFGGGTPSLLSSAEISVLIHEVKRNFNVAVDAEITLEMNPDDDRPDYLEELKTIGVNRLSVGIQSFHETDLVAMNRAHSAYQAKKCLDLATRYFDNITIDLMFGMPTMSMDLWRENLQIAFGFGIKHLSCYAMTVEPQTALEHFIKKGSHPPLDDELAANHFKVLIEEALKDGFIHYETCSFGKSDYFSKHNTSYWLGKPYLGVGPSAHSFNGKKRSWNISNNSSYIRSLEASILPSESEILSIEDTFNEYIMTGLRTMWGVSLKKIETEYGLKMKEQLIENTTELVKSDFLVIEDHYIKITPTGKFLSDGIASKLFLV